MGYIYKFESPSGKVYVGQTVQKPEQRKNDHLKKSSNCVLLKHALAKYKDEMKFSVIEEVENDKLDEKERFWIEELSCLAPNGYNLSSGGNEKKELSSVLKEKISTGNKNYFMQKRGYLGSVKTKSKGFAPTVTIDKKTVYLSIGVFNTREEAIEVLKQYTKDPLNFKKVEAPIKRNVGCVYLKHNRWTAIMKHKYLGSFESREEAEKCLQIERDKIQNKTI